MNQNCTLRFEAIYLLVILQHTLITRSGKTKATTNSKKKTVSGNELV